jgi:hypothetical protein
VVSGGLGHDRIPYLRRGMRYLLDNCYFEEGEIRGLRLSEDSFTDLPTQVDEIKLRIAVEYASEIREHIPLSKFVDKYGIDKNVLIDYLDRKRAYIDSLVMDLTTTERSVSENTKQ